jgi:hypothetical protein
MLGGKKKERKEALEYSREMKVILKEELIQEVFEAIEKLEHAKNNP